MPYIKQEQRNNFEIGIEWMQEALHRYSVGKDGEAGDLNYVITSLLGAHLRNGVSYRKINMLVGVLDCVKMELYRRAAAGYEDQKKQENGDVSPYEELGGQ
jgi:hypothetical protein